MKKLLLAAVAAVLLAPVAPAQADPNPSLTGGCGATSVSDGGDDDQTTWQGEVSAYALATHSQAGVLAPTKFIEVECYVRKNGSYQGTVLYARGMGVAAAASEYVYQADPNDVIEICTIIDRNNDNAWCDFVTTIPLVPEAVQQAVDDVVDPVEEIRQQWVDPATCPILAIGWGAGVPGLLDITWEGDVYVGGEFVYDCPPYSY